MELSPFFQLPHFPMRIYNKSFVCMCAFSLLNTQSWVCFWTLFSHGLFVYRNTNTTHSSFTISLDPLESKSCPVRFFIISWQLHFPINFIINLSISTHSHKSEDFHYDFTISQFEDKIKFFPFLLPLSIAIYSKPRSSYISGDWSL